MRTYIAKPAAGPIDNEASERRLRGLVGRLQEQVAALSRRVDDLEAKATRSTLKLPVTGEKAKVA
jgi:hypothetical protein